MTPRLSPAQRRVVDAMRDGAVLCIDHGRYWLWWTAEVTGALGFTEPVNGNTGWSLVSRGIVEWERGGTGYRCTLAPAYRDGEA